jgi:hypothetical protein
MKKLIIYLCLILGMGDTMAQIARDTVCPPSSPTEVRMGTVNNDIWTYWWCRNSTDVWAVWNTWLASEWKSSITDSTHSFIAGPNKRYLSLNSWANPVPLNTSGVPIGREHLWIAASAAIAADTTRPLPGTSTVQLGLQEIWVVTPNGSLPTRKTSKVINGVVQAYGSGTQTVKVGLPCDITKPSYPLGSLVKYLPLHDNTPATITDEVISCIRIQ